MADDHEDADRPVEAASPGVADSAAAQTAQPAEVSDADAEVTGASGTDRHPMFALSTRNSFTIGLIGTLGVLVALVIGGMISSSMVVLTYVAAGLFIALGLEPIIRGLARWHVPRPAAIVIVFGGLVIIMTALLIVMIPAVVNQVQQLAGNVPNLVDIVSQQRWFAIVNARFSGSFSEMLANATKFLSDPDSLMNVAGGVLSVSANIANGIGGAIIILVLTLYFMASLNGIKRGLVRCAYTS